MTAPTLHKLCTEARQSIIIRLIELSAYGMMPQPNNIGIMFIRVDNLPQFEQFLCDYAGIDAWPADAEACLAVRASDNKLSFLGIFSGDLPTHGPPDKRDARKGYYSVMSHEDAHTPGVTNAVIDTLRGKLLHILMERGSTEPRYETSIDVEGVKYSVWAERLAHPGLHYMILKAVPYREAP